jgi:hypothetical protein
MVKKILLGTGLAGGGLLAVLIALRGSAGVLRSTTPAASINAPLRERARATADPEEPAFARPSATLARADEYADPLRGPSETPEREQGRVSSAPKTLEEQKAEQEAAVALVESHFTRGVRDSNGIQVERDLRTSLQAANLTGVSVKEIGCVNTICKLTFSTEGIDSQHAAAEAMERSAVLPTEKLYQYSDDGRSVVVYAARDEEPLPRPSQQ